MTSDAEKDRGAPRAGPPLRPDPYAGADVQAARRLIPLLAGLGALLAAAFLPMAPPTAAIGDGGWAVAAALIAVELAVVVRMRRRAPSFDALLALAYGGVAGVALLEWLAGGHSPYASLYLLWIGAGAGVHPKRRALPLLAVAVTAGLAPLAYDEASADAWRDVVAMSMLWVTVGGILMALITTVRRQRVELRSGARSARAEAEEAARRVTALQEVTDVELAQLPLDELLRELLARIDSVLGLDAGAILLLDEEGDTLVVRAAHGIEAAAGGAPVAIPLGQGCAGRVAAERRAILVDDITDSSDLDPLFRGEDVRALLGLPLLVDGRLVGVLEVASREQRSFSGDDHALLELAADRLAQAIERTSLNLRAHHIAETLQRALLPDRLPEIPGVALAARYLPGGPGTDVGGDWYDVIPYPDGKVALVMGDVVGRGIGAAALMGQLRNGLRVYSIDHDEPAEILDRLNLLVERLEPGQMSTAVVLTFDPLTERLCVASAGHPPPLVLTADGSASYLESTPSVPLGVLPYGRYDAYRGTLPAGATLLLYTDGLVERRGASLGAGLRHLRAAVTSGPADPEELCEHVLQTLLPQGPPGDDVALLALRNVTLAGPRLHLELPADPDELATVRRSVERWLAASAVDEHAAHRITLACNEACMNAIEHGFGGSPPTFELDARLEGDTVDVTVRDGGEWRPVRGPGDGRGLDMMRALMDDVEVTPSADGTTVRLRRSVRPEGQL